MQLIVTSSKIFVRSFEIFSDIVYGHTQYILQYCWQVSSQKAHSYSKCEIYRQNNISSSSSLIAFSFSFQAPSMFLYFPLAAYF